MPPRFIPPDGPSDEALEAFAQAVECGLRELHPGYDFIVRRRPSAAPDEPQASPPDDRDPVRGD